LKLLNKFKGIAMVQIQNGATVSLWHDLWNGQLRMMSKWFYDTSTSVATGAARCGSFVGGGFGLLVASYG
jgi:hypothetical protein